MEEFEKWLRTVCFQKPTPESYDLAKESWQKSKELERERICTAIKADSVRPLDIPVSLEWTAPSAPNNDCHYNHCVADTPFGRFLLTWKGWKDYPDYGFDETPWGAVEYHGWGTVEDAQEWALQEMGRRTKACLNATPARALGAEVAAPLEAEIARLRAALEWYADEARACAKNSTSGNHSASQALLASVTVLALDGGKRADSALTPNADITCLALDKEIKK